MPPLATRIADLWLNRKRGDAAKTRAARAAVAHLTPVVLITGGSRGIGEALAKRFAAAGHRVTILARDPKQLATTAASIELATGQPVLTLTCDLTTPDAIARIQENLTQSGHYLDMLVNSAGMGLSGPFDRHTDASLDQLLSLNITAVTRLSHHALPGMLERRRGGILNVASLGAYVPGPNQAAYYASKAFVLSLTEAIAAEFAGQGVRISALVPGPVDTTFHTSMGAEHARYRQLLPSLSVERVARAGYRGFTLSQRVIAPGILARLSLGFLKLLPHPISVPLVAWLLKRPQKHD